MGFGSSIKGFDWDTFGFLIDFEGSGNSVLTFFVEFSTEIAFTLGIIALAWCIFQLMASQDVNILMVLLRITLVIILLNYYEPMCESLINLADEMAQTLIYNTRVDMNRAFLELADDEARKSEELYQAIYGNEELSEQEKDKLLKKHNYFNPYKLSLFDFNPLKLLASLLLILCQVAIVLIEKFRNVILSLLLLVGRICIVGFAWEKTEGFAKGWFYSFLNALSWTIWLAVIIFLQQYTGIRTVFASNASNEDMINGIASCLVFLFMYLQVFGLGKELLAGSFGASASSLGTSIGTGLAGKYMAKGLSGGAKGLSGGMKNFGRYIYDHFGVDNVPSIPRFSFGGSGLTEMDPSVSPVRIDDALPPPQTQQITGENYMALPAAPQPDFYGSAYGTTLDSSMFNDISYYDPSNDSGPVIDADYTSEDKI